MSNTIAQEIIDWLNSGTDGEVWDTLDQEAWNEFYEELPNPSYSWHREKEGPALASGIARIVEDFGGEGQGDTRYVVFSVGEKFYKVEGYYASWDGTTWDDPTPFEVRPKEVTVIEYEAV